MATNLFSLVGSILIDNEKANESLSKTDQKAQGVGKTLLNGAKTAGKFAAGFATAAAGAVAGITAVTGKAAENLDVVDKASQRMKIGAESYQELAHAADLSGVSMSTMEAAAKKLEGTGLNMDDALEQIYSLNTAEERAAAAAELFGEKVAYQMTPMLNASGEEFANMKQEAHDLGLVLDQDTVSAGAKLNDSLNNIKAALGGVVTQLGAQLMPVVQAACDFIIAALPSIQGLFDKLAPVLSNLFETLMPQLMSLADQLLPVLMNLLDMLLPVFTNICEAILPVIVNLISELVPPIMKLVQDLMPIFVSLMDALLPLLQPLFGLLSPILNIIIALLQPLIDIVNTILPPLVTLISKNLAGALNVLKPLLDAVAKLLKGDFAGAFESVKQAMINWVNAIKGAFSAGFEAIKTLLNNLKTRFVSIFNGIRDAVKTPINAVIGFINGLVGGVTSGLNAIVKAMNKLSFDVPDWVPGMGGKKFGFDLKEITAPKIPLLAEGAVIEPRKPFAAVLGDQTNGTNVEAPLETIKQAVSEVIAELNINVNLSGDLDDGKIFKRVRKQASIYSNMTGNPAFD